MKGSPEAAHEGQPRRIVAGVESGVNGRRGLDMRGNPGVIILKAYAGVWVSPARSAPGATRRRQPDASSSPSRGRRWRGARCKSLHTCGGCTEAAPARLHRVQLQQIEPAAGSVSGRPAAAQMPTMEMYKERRVRRDWHRFSPWEKTIGMMSIFVTGSAERRPAAYRSLGHPRKHSLCVRREQPWAPPSS